MLRKTLGVLSSLLAPYGRYLPGSEGTTVAGVTLKVCSRGLFLFKVFSNGCESGHPVVRYPLFWFLFGFLCKLSFSPCGLWRAICVLFSFLKCSYVFVSKNICLMFFSPTACRSLWITAPQQNSDEALRDVFLWAHFQLTSNTSNRFANNTDILCIFIVHVKNRNT